MKTLKIHVKGMTCSSCEVLLERSVSKVPGVNKVTVNRGREEMTVEGSDDITVNKLKSAVDSKYILSEGNAPRFFITKDRERLAEIGAVLMVILGIYFVLKEYNLLPQGIGISENMSYGVIFLIGLIAATSTCLAVAGGLLLVVSAKYNEAYPHLTGWQKFRPHISFNVGRVVSYTLLGGMIGLLGSFITLSPRLTGLLTIAASALMILVGFQLLHIFPWLNRIQVKMPKFLAHKIYGASQEGKPSNRGAFFFGAATFFLPCGFTQALQLYVLSKGDFMTGALTMFAFSLGTLPTLAGIGAVSSYVKGKAHRHFMTFSALLVIVLGIFNMPNGLALAGSAFSFGGPQMIEDSNVNMVNGKQIVEMKIDSLDYVPSQFTVVAGVPVEWRIDGRTAQGCAQVISLPQMGITEYLPKNQIKTITFTPTQPGQLTFSCSMGMAGPGVFNVVPNTKGGAGPQLAAVGEDTEAQPVVDGPVQKLSMEVSKERGFYPNSFTVKKSIPVELEIDTKVQMGGCMSTLIIPEYNVAQLLRLGKSVMRFTPTKTGIIPFTCSMGAKMGQFIVN